MPWTEDESGNRFWVSPNDRVEHAETPAILGFDGTENGFVLGGVRYPNADSALVHNLKPGAVPGSADISPLSIGNLRAKQN